MFFKYGKVNNFVRREYVDFMGFLGFFLYYDIEILLIMVDRRVGV